MKHRCAVCREVQQGHDGWYAHAREAHDSNLDDFFYDRCLGRPGHEGEDCPGVRHAKRLPNFGEPPVRRGKDLGQPVKARDGTVYTPIPLW